jgi:hypothetical protein
MGRLFLISACPRPVVAAALASLDTLMPLHSAVAAARLRSCIAADSACWSCLSQGEPGASFRFLFLQLDVGIHVGWLCFPC